VSAAELVALIQMLQFKTAAASRLAQDLVARGFCRVARMPSEALRGLPEEEQTSERAEEGQADTSRERLQSPLKKEEIRTDSTPAKQMQEISSDAPSRTESSRSLLDVSRVREPPWDACDPEDVGLDRDPLEKCRRYLNYRVGRKHFAGIVQGVVKNGKLVYFDEVGYADVASKTPMRQDTLMRLFSMTKCIVAVAFLTYAEDPEYGIDLDDPVWKYIPSFKKLTLAPKRASDKPRQLESKFQEVKADDGSVKKAKLPIGPTLRQLLTHSAGLGYGPTLGDTIPPTDKDHYKIYFDLVERASKGQIKSIEEWVDELAKIPLKSNPGSYWEYSFALDVLGRVVEVVSGKPLEQAVDEKVCAPLGMVDTCFRVPPEKARRMGAWYEKKAPVDDKGTPLEKVPCGATWNLEVLDKAGLESGWVGDNASRIFSGGGTIELPLSIKGGMVSTFRDYLRFLMMIRNFGELDGVRILRRETVQTMLCNQVPASTNRRTAWVFDKKGQGYNFIGQIQVQHPEKETFQEKGELKRGNTTYASLAPGTVSSEYGWGGLGGPAFTVDPRSDLVILSMTQTAFELDHEENLRFSARRAIHAGIFGETAGPSKVTDVPPEFHEAKRVGKLLPKPIERRRVPFVSAKNSTEAELKAELADFMEAEEKAMLRPKSLKEISISTGNIGHEVKDIEEDDDMDSVDANKVEDPSGEVIVATPASRELRKSPSSSSEDNGTVSTKRDRPEGDRADRKAKQAKTSSKKSEGSPSVQVEASPNRPASAEGIPLFARVSVPVEGESTKVFKARVTGVEGKQLEVVTEGQYKTMNVGAADVSVIDETQFAISRAPDACKGPSDFSFLMPDADKQANTKDVKTPKKVVSTPTRTQVSKGT
jgi:CubicO group peptidase (beta-lactamase class C family)